MTVYLCDHPWDPCIKQTNVGQMCGCTGFKSGTLYSTVVIINLITIIDHSRMTQALRFIEISKYDDGGQLTTRGQLMQGSSRTPRNFMKPLIIAPMVVNKLWNFT